MRSLEEVNTMSPSMGSITLVAIIPGKRRSHSDDLQADIKKQKLTSKTSFNSDCISDDSACGLEKITRTESSDETGSFSSIYTSSDDDEDEDNISHSDEKDEDKDNHSDDDDIQIIEIHTPSNHDKPKILEVCDSNLVRNPFYEGDDSSRTSSPTEDIEVCEDFGWNVEDVKIRNPKILVTKCKAQVSVDRTWTVRTKAVNVKMKKTPDFRRNKVQPDSGDKVPPTSNTANDHQIKENKDETFLINFELCDRLGNYQPIWSVQEFDDQDLYIYHGSSGKELGPVDSYRKVYNSMKLDHYKIEVASVNYKVRREDFTHRYEMFCKENIYINPYPVRTSKADRRRSFCAAVPKFRKAIPDIDNIINCLGLDDSKLDSLPNIMKSLQPFSHDPIGIKWIAAFIQFCHERMKRWKLKRLQMKDDGRDPIFSRRKFTNLARELDRGTQYLREQILPSLLSCHRGEIEASDLLPNILFKSCVYRLMNKVETFERFHGIPDPDRFDSFMLFINIEMESGRKVFTGVHQNMGLERYENTINFIRMNLLGISTKIFHQERLENAFEIIKSLPNFGDFFAWQVLSDLTESRLLSFKNIDEWTSLGPGALKGIKLVLGNKFKPLQGTRLLRRILEEAETSWLELNIPDGISLNCKLIEHSLCEFSKYCRFSGEPPTSKQFISRSHLDLKKQCLVCQQGSVSAEPSLHCLFCNRKCHVACAGQDPDQLMYSCTDCSTINNSLRK